jgi:diguanylate cyclase (GGDEF)-like protein
MSALARLVLPRSPNLKPVEARLLTLAFSLCVGLVLITAAAAVGGIGGAWLHDAIEKWLKSAVYVLVAAIVALRAVREPHERTQWMLIAIGLCAYGVGSIVWAFCYSALPDPPIPSICDVLWLMLYPLSCAGIIGLARANGDGRVPGRFWLDGAIAITGLGAIGAALVFAPVLAGHPAGMLVGATELAYPIGDVLLVVVVLAVLALRRWRLDVAWVLLSLGFLSLAVGDSIFAVDVAHGSTDMGTVINLFFMLGVTALAAAAWQVNRAELSSRAASSLALALPASFALAAAGLLIRDHFKRLDPVAFGLCIAAVLAAIVRMAVAYRDQRAVAMARHQATTDDLTELPNRRSFVECTKRALKVAELSGESLSVLILDLDTFKTLNDTLGHEAGDSLLQRVGPRLRRVLRESDLVARLGGDEFGILIQHQDSAGAEQVAHKLLRVLDEPFPVAGLLLRVTGSVGIASFPDHARTAAELMRRADVALNTAKADGDRPIAEYVPDRDTNSRERLLLASELAAALEHGGIDVHFQPKADAATRRVVGAEALVRWRRDGTLLQPGEFLPVCEQAGLSRVLTRVVLAKTLDQLKSSRERGWDLTVAVNTTAADLLDDRFCDEVVTALQVRGIPPEALTLEVTEQSVLSDWARVDEVLGRLGEMGIELSLDDFGTGYSSLSHMRQLPVGEIKLDRSFVSWMRVRKDDEAIVCAVIELAHKLGMRVVAEGVEDVITWQILSQLDCEVIQGYALGRPMPAAEFEASFMPQARGAIASPSSALD